MILGDPEGDPVLREFLRSGGDAGGRFESEATLLRRDGSSFTGEVSAIWLPRESRKATWVPVLTGPIGMIILRDIMEKRRLEKQVVEMQKMEAVGTLAGGIAHDFNNILTGILGNLDLARNVLPSASLAWLPVKESIRASERAAHMVRQLLDFSRRSPLERRALDLGKVAMEVADLFSQTIDKRIEVGIVSDPDLWLASADPNQMHQVMMNLCVNARDAIMERLEGEPEGGTAEGAFRIRLVAGNARIGEEYCRMYPYARQGDFVVLSISDNGVGMDEATRRRIFEPFFTTKKLGRGTGLGLSTVYGIIKQHGGWINLESRLREGTTFHTYLPRAVESAQEAAPVAEGGHRETGKETILLVDDEEMIRSVAQQILEVHGYSVLTASDGQEAIDLYVRERERIDLIILDMTMPRLTGGDVLGRIRNLNPDARVILSSGYPSGESHIASAFLPKPYRAESLTRIVREVLDR
jgi:signal transduction histidine kinase